LAGVIKEIVMVKRSKCRNIDLKIFYTCSKKSDEKIERLDPENFS
jgi:hypothetical protein